MRVDWGVSSWFRIKNSLSRPDKAAFRFACSSPRARACAVNSRRGLYSPGAAVRPERPKKIFSSQTGPILVTVVPAHFQTSNLG